VIKSHVLYRLSYGLGAPLLTEKLAAFPASRLVAAHLPQKAPTPAERNGPASAGRVRRKLAGPPAALADDGTQQTRRKRRRNGTALKVIALCRRDCYIARILPGRNQQGSCRCRSSTALPTCTTK
jgi:hypothetical protein